MESDLRRLEDFLNIQDHSLKFEYTTRGITQDHETWKVGSPEVVKRLSKASEVFTPEEIRYIERYVTSVEG